jgi:hypothetical protein
MLLLVDTPFIQAHDISFSEVNEQKAICIFEFETRCVNVVTNSNAMVTLAPPVLLPVDVHARPGRFQQRPEPPHRPALVAVGASGPAAPEEEFVARPAAPAIRRATRPGDTWPGRRGSPHPSASPSPSGPA